MHSFENKAVNICLIILRYTLTMALSDLHLCWCKHVNRKDWHTSIWSDRIKNLVNIRKNTSQDVRTREEKTCLYWRRDCVLHHQCMEQKEASVQINLSLKRHYFNTTTQPAAEFWFDIFHDNLESFTIKYRIFLISLFSMSLLRFLSSIESFLDWLVQRVLAALFP